MVDHFSPALRFGVRGLNKKLELSFVAGGWASQHKIGEVGGGGDDDGDCGEGVDHHDSADDDGDRGGDGDSPGAPKAK